VASMRETGLEGHYTVSHKKQAKKVWFESAFKRV